MPQRLPTEGVGVVRARVSTTQGVNRTPPNRETSPGAQAGTVGVSVEERHVPPERLSDPASIATSAPCRNRSTRWARGGRRERAEQQDLVLNRCDVKIASLSR